MKFEVTVRPEILGKRLKAARSLVKLTQEAASASLKIARTTLVAIESGKRTINSEELRAFSELYKLSEGELLSEARQPLDLGVKFRSSGGIDKNEDDLVSVASILNRLATSATEIESLIGYVPPKVELPTLILNKEDPLEQQAEDAALSQRQRLGIGLGPISNLQSLMELDLGLRVFERPLPSKVGGAVAYDEEHGGYVLLNSNHPEPKRRLTAAHEICHLLLKKSGLEVIFDSDQFEEKEDKFCDAFARALLMPAVTVRKKASDLKGLSGILSVRHLLMMAIYFYVSIEAMCRRLENLKLVEKGMFNTLKTQGLGLKHLEQVRVEIGAEPVESKFTPRLLILAGEAFDRELLSEQQIAKKLDLDIVTVRRTIGQDSLVEI